MMSDTAAMSDTDPHANATDAALAHDDRHAAGDPDPGMAGGHGHGHSDTAEPLGPPDLVAWAYAVAGGAVGLVTALALYVAAQP
jgi:hypothetical protein